MSKLGTLIPLDHLSKHQAGESVRVVAKIVKFDAAEAVLEGPNSKQVRILNPNTDNYTNSRFIEVMGDIKDPNGEIPSIDEVKSVSYGNKFNLSLHDRMLRLVSGNYRAIFRASPSEVDDSAMETE
ncbi:hypothetical protein AAMO2058_001680100 [Amorphochlora amoebiformis]